MVLEIKTFSYDFDFVLLPLELVLAKGYSRFYKRCVCSWYRDVTTTTSASSQRVEGGGGSEEEENGVRMGLAS